MNKWISLLSGLLIAQLVLAVTVNLSGQDYGTFQAQEKLLTFQRDQIDALRLEGDGQSLLLKKRDGRWRLPDHGDFPADQGSVKRLLDKLAALEKGWPVATSGSAARRFKVAEDDYQRRLALLADDKSLAELYVGTSPGFRKVHVRPEGDDAVYSVTFNTWEANAKPDDWIDKQILKLDKGSVLRIELPGVVLQRDGDALRVADLGDREQANSGQIDTLLDKLAGLRIQSLLGQEVKPEYQQDSPALEIGLARTADDPLTYRFSKPQEGSDYVLKRSDLDYYFKLPEYTVKPLLEATREQLVQTKPEAQSRVDESAETSVVGGHAPETDTAVVPAASAELEVD